jgi:hypothetical protein
VTVQQDRFPFAAATLLDPGSFITPNLSGFTPGATMLATPPATPQINQSYQVEAVGINAELTIGGGSLFGRLGKIVGGILLPSDPLAAGDAVPSQQTGIAAGAGNAAPGAIPWAGPPWTPSGGLPPNSTSETLQFAGCGFNVPANATITGVAVSYQGSDGASFGAGATNTITQLIQSGALIGVNRAYGFPFNQGGYLTLAFGSASDVWGVALTPAIINDPTFGVGVQVGNSGGSFTLTPAIPRNPTVTVYYTTPASLTPLPNPNLTFTVWDPASDALPPYFALPGTPTTNQALQVGGLLQLASPLQLTPGTPITIGLWMLPSLLGSSVAQNPTGLAVAGAQCYLTYDDGR